MNLCAAGVLQLLRTAEAGWAGLLLGLLLVFWPWQRSREARAEARVWGAASIGMRYERLAGGGIAVLSLLSLFDF